MSTVKTNDPITLAIDYPDRPVNRLTSFFRWITVIPIGIIALIMIQTLPFFSMGAQYNADEQELQHFFANFSTTGIQVGDLIILTAIAALLVPLGLFLS